MRHPFPWFLMMAAALASCARTAKLEQEKQFNPIGPAGTPLIRSKNSGGDAGTPVVPGGNASPAPTLEVTPDSEIVFTNPDNPEANLPELSEVLASAPKHRGPWEESESIAKQRSAREGKPLLIWFTNSQTSPMCKALSQELFSTPEFGSWAAENIIRLRVDSNFERSDFVTDPDIDLLEKESRRADARTYVANLKKRYKVLGSPTLLLLNPSGEVIGRYRGYERGQADFKWGLIKHGVAVSAHAYKEWHASLEKRGYREWRDRKERKVFAKLTGYSNGTLILIEPDGTRCRTDENKLSDKDREWITTQKKLRNLQ